MKLPIRIGMKASAGEPTRHCHCAWTGEEKDEGRNDEELRFQQLLIIRVISAVRPETELTVHINRNRVHRMFKQRRVPGEQRDCVKKHH